MFDLDAKNRGNQTESHAGDSGKHERENQDEIVHADRVHSRQIFGQERTESANTPVGESDSNYSTEKTEHGGFTEQLADDSTPAGAKRGANSDFFRARSGSREKQVGDIGAGDQQHETDGTQEDQQRGSDVSHNFFLHRHETDGPAFILRRKFARQPFADRVHFGLSLRDRNSGLQPPKDC